MMAFRESLSQFYRHRGRRGGIIGLLLVCALFILKSRIEAQTPEPLPYRLKSAQLCEAVSDGGPQTVGVVFSVSRGKVFCLTGFTDIKEESAVHHHWYSRDRLVAKVKLALHPPSWSTYSNIQLRQSDKGPWRVEILDEKETILKTLRFSVTD